MYHAKGQGGNSYRFYSPTMNIRSDARARLESRLRQALDRAELEIHYQPQLTVDHRQVVCAEALVRWRHPESGMLDPRASFHWQRTGIHRGHDEWVPRRLRPVEGMA